MSDVTKNRMFEVLFYLIMNKVKTAIVSENREYFLENFCRVMSVDYTSITILMNMWLSKLAPVNEDYAVLAYYGIIRKSDAPMDIRTLRKYTKRFEEHGLQDRHPITTNTYLVEDLNKFVLKYISLFSDIGIKYQVLVEEMGDGDE